MNELINFLTSKEIIVVYMVAGVACFLCFIIYLIDKTYYKRKRKHNTRELNKLVEEVNRELEEEGYDTSEEVYNTPVLAPIEEYSEDYEFVEEEKDIEDMIVENMEIQQAQVEEDEFEDEIIGEEIIEPVVEEPVVIEEEQEELSYTDIEPNKEEAQAELRRLTEELMKAEALAQQELETQEETPVIEEEVKNVSLTSYEEEQEENAIISLEELVRKSKDMYEQNELTQYADEGNEPISLQDLEIKMKEYSFNEPTTVESIVEQIESLEEPVVEEPVIIEAQPVVIEQQKLVLDDFNTVKVEPVEEVPKTISNAYQTTKKFKSSPVISPIYGIRPQSELELENTANYEKLDEEIKKTNEFVMTLKELQSHLD